MGQIASEIGCRDSLVGHSGTVRVLAVGSPHGDDRAGWEVAERFWRDGPAGVEARILADPLRLPENLDGCDRVVIVDACRGGAEPGSIVRMEWPADQLLISACHSTHGFGVAAALALAEALRRLPPRVALLGIEAGPCEPGAGLSPVVRAALPELYRRVLREVSEVESEEDCHE